MVVLIKRAVWDICVCLGLSVGWLVSLSKDLLKNLTIIEKILSFSINPFLKFSNIFINFHRPTDKVTYW